MEKDQIRSCHHIDEFDWRTFDAATWGPLRWKELLNATQGGSKEFVFGYAELDPGKTLPLHQHPQTETIFIISGAAKVRLGRGVVELEANSAAQFPGDTPHSLEAIGPETLRYIYTYVCDEFGHRVQPERPSENKASEFFVLNNAETRWAVHEDFEQWEPVEPSKGSKGMHVRWMFGVGKGKADEIMAGTCRLQAGAHYTLHYHDQPEIFYCLSGQGIIYVGDHQEKVYPGSAVYVGSRVVHGADATGTEPLRMYWLYGTKWTKGNFNWTPVEDIYTDRRDR